MKLAVVPVLRALHCRFQNYLCLATPQPHREDGSVPEEKKTVLEEKERKIIPEWSVQTMSVIQTGEGITMTMTDVPDMMIIVEETVIVTVIAILEGLTAKGTEKVKMTMTGPLAAGPTANGVGMVEMTATDPAGAEVETSQSRLVVLHPQNDHLLFNPPLPHALALSPSPLHLSTRPNPTLLILGCWLQRQMLSS